MLILAKVNISCSLEVFQLLKTIISFLKISFGKPAPKPEKEEML